MSAVATVRTITCEQPLPTPRQQHGLALYQWWKLPSGQVVEVRRILGTSAPECVVRNVNEDGEMAAGEYCLTLRFLVTRAKKVKR